VLAALLLSLTSLLVLAARPADAQPSDPGHQCEEASGGKCNGGNGNGNGNGNGPGGGGQTQVLSSGFTNPSGAADGLSGSLPFTGIEALALVLLGAGVVALGLGFRKASQRA